VSSYIFLIFCILQKKQDAERNSFAFRGLLHTSFLYNYEKYKKNQQSKKNKVLGLAKFKLKV